MIYISIYFRVLSAPLKSPGNEAKNIPKVWQKGKQTYPTIEVIKLETNGRECERNRCPKAILPDCFSGWFWPKNISFFLFKVQRLTKINVGVASVNDWVLFVCEMRNGFVLFNTSDRTLTIEKAVFFILQMSLISGFQCIFPKNGKANC